MKNFEFTDKGFYGMVLSYGTQMCIPIHAYYHNVLVVLKYCTRCAVYNRFVRAVCGGFVRLPRSLYIVLTVVLKNADSSKIGIPGIRIV